ncbi:MAG: GAF domain-containing protein, partial [Chloroflexi bacterium]|nr:GAF domain-containing protein [Chloroflexota bacterium]
MVKKSLSAGKAVKKAGRSKPEAVVKPVRAEPAKVRKEAKRKSVKRVTAPKSNQADVKRQLKIQKALYEIADAASSVKDMQSFYKKMHKIVGKLMYAENFFISLYDPTTNTRSFPYYVDSSGDIAPEPGPVPPQAMYAQMILHPGTIHFNRRQNEEAVRAGRMTGTPSEDFVAVPLMMGNQLVGGIVVQSYIKGIGYSDEDVHVLEFIAKHIATALTRARAIEETRQRNAELQIINSILQGLASKLDFQAIVDLVGDKLREIFNTGDIGINWYDEKANLAHYLYVYEHGVRLTPPPPNTPRTKAWFKILETRKPIVVNTTAESIEMFGPAIAGTDESKSMVRVPIIASDHVIGTITIENFEREYGFSESDVRLLQTVASSMGVALENARLFDETQRLLKETEQRNAELSIINSIQQGLASKLDFQAIVDLVGDKLREVLVTGEIGIRWLDSETDMIHYLYEYEHGERLTIPPREANTSVTWRQLVETRQPVVYRNYADY